MLHMLICWTGVISKHNLDMKLMSKPGGLGTTTGKQHPSSGDLPEHLQDGPPQRRSPGGCVGLTCAQKHWVVGDDAHGR